MRWRLDTYELKYNPSQLSKQYRAKTGANLNIDGTMSNTNIDYDGSQDFTIDLYEKPTKTTSLPVTFTNNLYIAVSEDRVFEDVYLLRTNSIVDIKKKTGVAVRSFTITATTVTLPTGNPISMAHMDSEVAFLYRDATSSTVLITDENGSALRKYIYNNTLGDISYLDSIGFDYNKTLYATNPYGKIYSIDKTNGDQAFLVQFGDFSTNQSGGVKKYKSIHVLEKQGRQFIGLVTNGDIIYLNSEYEVSCKAQTGLTNVAHVSFSNYVDKYLVLMSNGLREMTTNTCRLDIDIIKKIISSGMVTVYNELNLAHIMTITGMRVSRKKNMSEARYEISLEGTIAYSNQTYGGQWFNISK